MIYASQRTQVTDLATPTAARHATHCVRQGNQRRDAVQNACGHQTGLCVAHQTFGCHKQTHCHSGTHDSRPTAAPGAKKYRGAVQESQYFRKCSFVDVVTIHCPPPPLLPRDALEGGDLAQGLGIRLFAFGGAYWPVATAHSDPLWVRTCFGCVIVCGWKGGRYPLCDIPSGRCFSTGPWRVTRSSLRMLRRVAAFCRPLRPEVPPHPLQGAQPMPSHCPPDAKCQLQWHL